MFYILNVREKLTHEIHNRKNSSKNIIWNWISHTSYLTLPKQTKLKLMTTIMMFFKDLERYGIYKDSQFILSIPQELLRELIDRWKEIEKKDSSPKEKNKMSFGELSAVEWLIEQLIFKQEYEHLPNNYFLMSDKDIDKIIEQAKEMEKQQIIDAFYQCGRDNFEHIKVINRSATDYYNETYGSKGSDEYKYHEQRRGINVDSFQSVAPQKQDYIIKVTDVISSQTEISDEEIYKEVEKHYKGLALTRFVQGAKWYREQLKCKGNG